MKQRSCKTGKPKRITCERADKVKSVDKHAQRNVIDSIHDRERSFNG